MSHFTDRSAVGRETPSAFDTMETQFFTEGDQISTAVAPGDAWDEPTTSARVGKRRRTSWLLGWALGIVLIGLAWAAHGSL